MHDSFGSDRSSFSSDATDSDCKIKDAQPESTPSSPQYFDQGDTSRSSTLAPAHPLQRCQESQASSAFAQPSSAIGHSQDVRYSQNSSNMRPELTEADYAFGEKSGPGSLSPTNDSLFGDFINSEACSDDGNDSKMTSPGRC
jgi:hypothetical protein